MTRNHNAAGERRPHHQEPLADVMPDIDPEIDEAAVALAFIDAELKRLRRDRELRESILLARMSEKGMQHYGGHGLSVSLERTVKAKVQVFDGRTLQEPVA